MRSRCCVSLVGGREVGVSVDDSPVPVDASQDVGDAQGHLHSLAPVDTHLATFEPDGVGEIAAVPDHLLARDQSAVGESARHPVEGPGHRPVAALDRPPGAEQRDVAMIGPQRRVESRVTTAHGRQRLLKVIEGPTKIRRERP